jgi:hypothetical protein
MTTSELETRPSSATYAARARVTPAGDAELSPGDVDASAFGPVEIAWYRDRLRITACGAGPGSITESSLGGEAAQDVIVEIRLPSLEELTETVPGAD